MSQSTIRTLATYGIAAMVLLGAFLIIYQGRGDASQAWLTVGAVLGYILRDAGGSAATSSVERIAAAVTPIQNVNATPAVGAVNVNPPAAPIPGADEDAPLGDDQP